jgi:tRNA(fMet)-specific endonuclease VapC
MNGYLLDTNIVTAHLKGHSGVRQRILEAELGGHPVRLNAVSYYETKRGLLAIGAHRQLTAFERLWRVLGIVMIDQAVVGPENS